MAVPHLRAAARRRAPRHTRLRIDRLEDRAVPATLSALAPLNPVGSLAYQATGSGEVSAGTPAESFTVDLPAGQTLSVRVTPAGAVAGAFQWRTEDGGNGNYYIPTAATGTWAAAQAEAVGAGGHLVSVTSAAEQQFVRTTFQTGAWSGREYWLGFTDQATEGQWAWVTGEAAAYTNWDTGEPNDSGGNEDHTLMVGSGRWNDMPATASRLGLIELPGASGLVPAVTVTGPGGQTVGSVTGANGTDPVTLMNLPVATAGTYTVTVTGGGGSTGGFTTRVLLNAALEREGPGSPTNDDRASAEDLGPAFAPLGNGARAAVAGRLPASGGPAAGNQDWYSVNLAAGETVALAVTVQGPGGAHLELFDAAGAVALVAGDPAPTNVGEAVTFTAPAAGTYFARVFRTDADPAPGADYTLVVSRGALDLEPNSGPAVGTSNPIGPSATAVGAVEAGGFATFIPSGSGGLNQSEKVAVHGGDLFVVSRGSDQVMRYDGATGAPKPSAGNSGAVFATGGLSDPMGLAFGADGHLYVADYAANTVARFDGATGAALGTFVTAGLGGLTGPAGITFGADGHLYVVSRNSNQVMRYDGATGAALPSSGNPGAVFATGGGLNVPDGLTFGPDGRLYVASQATNQVMRYDSATGAFVSVFVAPGNGLSTPLDLRFGAESDLYVTSFSGGQLLRYQGPAAGSPGAFHSIVPTGPLSGPTGLTFGPGGALFVTSRGDNRVVRSGAAADFYRIGLDAGDRLTVTTATPLGPRNALDPLVRLYAPGGAVIGSDDNSAPDGRNARLEYEVAAPGTYFVAVTSAGSTGEYALTTSTVLGPPPEVVVADASIVEGDTGTSLDFTVRLNRPTARTVTVRYATADGTAQAGPDYTSLAGTLTFDPGQTEKTVSVAVGGDLDDEADEAFQLVLSAPVNAALADPTAAGTIQDDDNTPALAVSDPAAVNEPPFGTAAVGFRVTLSEAGKKPVTVHYTTAGGTATAGTDYEAASGDLTFLPGETEKTVTVTVLDDFRAEADETIGLVLSAPVNATLGDPTGSATVRDNDPPPVAKAGPDRAAKEGAVVRFSAAGSSSPIRAPLTYAWAFGDGGTATGKSVSYRYADNGTYTARLTVTDAYGSTATDDVVVTVGNLPPKAAMVGPAKTVPGWARPFTFSAADPGVGDRTTLTYRINWGEGPREDIVGGPAITAAHAYSAPGKYTVRLEAVDKDGGLARAVQKTVVVTPTVVEGGTTFVPGTGGDDTIGLRAADSKGTKVEVVVNGQPVGTYATAGVAVLGLGGNDTITTTGAISRRLYLYGGDGNDTLDATSAVGPTVLVGGAGDDTATGGAGRDVLIGGAGADALDGRAGDDLALGGLVSFADDPTRLTTVLSEWSRTPTTYEQRRDHLLGTLRGGLNGRTVLGPAAVADDTLADALTGGSGRDWFFDATATADALSDPAGDETVTRL